MDQGASGSSSGMSIGQYLIKRLQDYGIHDIFGIPGDYVLNFYGMLEKSPIRTVNCTREDCAGFAADAYARVRGMGAVCVTYCVGGLSVCNSIAGAYAEKSPVVVISGAPGMGERMNDPLLHHKVKDFDTQIEVFEKLCVAGAELSDSLFAFREIDRVLDTCARRKRPVYLELPRDMVNVAPAIAHTYASDRPSSDPHTLQEAAAEAAEWLAKAERPVILAGVEIHRFGLQDQLLALAETLRIPIACTLLGKSVVRETHPLFVGIYEGAMGRDEVTKFVEDSDCILLLGAFMTDINLGIFTANLDVSQCIYATSEQLRIRRHNYQGVLLTDFLQAIADRKPSVRPREAPAALRRDDGAFHMAPQQPISISRLIARLNQQLDDNTIVIADIGDALFAATDLIIRDRTDFLSPAYYTSMGFAVPAALGAHTARPEARVVAIVGDGAFQMTGMELSTLLRYGHSPIVIVLDNHGYGTERVLHPGNWDYNEIRAWRYSKLPEVLGGGRGYEIRTEGEFDQALTSAWDDTHGPSILHVHISATDCSNALRRLAERLGKKV